jgi:biopolymer transport protein ExbB
VGIVELFRAGGIMMYPLLVCSIAGLALILLKYITLTMAGRRSRRLLARISELLAQHKFDEARAACEQSGGPVAAILAAGLRRMHEGPDRVIRAIEHTGAAQLSSLERGLAALATVATISPLIGFLGTVAGMIQAFGAIEAYGEVEPTIVAGGIKVALITTAAGLIIAIPASAAHSYFVAKVDRIILDMEEISEHAVDSMHAREMKSTRPNL